MKQIVFCVIMVCGGPNGYASLSHQLRRKKKIYIYERVHRFDVHKLSQQQRWRRYRCRRRSCELSETWITLKIAKRQNIPFCFQNECCAWAYGKSAHYMRSTCEHGVVAYSLPAYTCVCVWGKTFKWSSMDVDESVTFTTCSFLILVVVGLYLWIAVCVSCRKSTQKSPFDSKKLPARRDRYCPDHFSLFRIWSAAIGFQFC